MARSYRILPEDYGNAMNVEWMDGLDAVTIMIAVPETPLNDDEFDDYMAAKWPAGAFVREKAAGNKAAPLRLTDQVRDITAKVATTLAGRGPK